MHICAGQATTTCLASRSWYWTAPPRSFSLRPGRNIGVDLLACFGRKMEGFRFLVYLVVFSYQGNPSVCPKRTPMGRNLNRAFGVFLGLPRSAFGRTVEAGAKSGKEKRKEPRPRPPWKGNRQLDVFLVFEGSVHFSSSAGSAPGRRVQKGAMWVFLKIWGSHK